MGVSNKAPLRKEHGKLVQFVDNADMLPSVFRTLLSHSKWD